MYAHHETMFSNWPLKFQEEKKSELAAQRSHAKKQQARIRKQRLIEAAVPKLMGDKAQKESRKSVSFARW
jgi:hypothetical protein